MRILKSRRPILGGMALPRILEPEVMDSESDSMAYEIMDHAGPNAAFVDRLLELGAGGRMLDIGTGPGHIPVLVCQAILDCEVIAVDLAESMLAFAEEKRQANDLSSRLEFRLADAKNLPFNDQQFDTVWSNTILHHIPDPHLFLREAWRVLRPGGALLIRDLFRPDSEEELTSLVRTYAGQEAPLAQELFRASLHAALTPEELTTTAQACGLEGCVVVVDTDRHMSLQRGTVRESSC